MVTFLFGLFGQFERIVGGRERIGRDHFVQVVEALGHEFELLLLGHVGRDILRDNFGNESIHEMLEASHLGNAPAICRH